MEYFIFILLAGKSSVIEGPVTFDECYQLQQQNEMEFCVRLHGDDKKVLQESAKKWNGWEIDKKIEIQEGGKIRYTSR